MGFSFSYEQTTRIIFGLGRVKETGALAGQYGKKALLVTMPESDVFKPLFTKMKQNLSDAGLTVVHFDGCVPNPTTEIVDRGAALAHDEQVDVIIGLGGGSAMDTAKAIGVAAVNPGNAWDYLFFKTPQPTATLPVICVTTTSGTGSQMTQVAVLTETATRTKSALYNNLLYPKIAVIDPELMLTMPAQVTAATGFDAFSHCFESYLHNGASPYTDIIALEGMRMVHTHLRTALADGSNPAAREGMAWADTCGGLAIANAGVTLPHGVGMTISGHCPHIAHGEALALTYPSFTRFTRPNAVQKFAAVGRILDSRLLNASDEAASEGCCEAIDGLLRDIGLWIGFKQFNVDQETLRVIAGRSHDLPDYKANPVVATIEDIYRQLTEGFERS